MRGIPHEIDTIVDEPATPEPEPSLGELFAERYRIDRCIGRGSMGTVYAAHDRVVDEMVALKLLATPSERALERFRREVRLARRVTHRNAARTFDLGAYHGVHFITMELVDGESVRIRMAREGRLAVGDVAEIARQVCLGLQAAHEVGVIHRDLKPGNVLLANERTVITDFGVAWSNREANTETLEHAPMAGTPAYMAPEQVMGLNLDTRADLYALGVMMFEMLTGRTPWSGGNRVEVAMARLHKTAPDPRAEAPVPDWLGELVLRCLASDPERRPASPAEVAEVLAQLASSPELALHPGIMQDPAASSMGSAFAPTSPGERALAVMPFRYHGPRDDDYLGEALTEELVDLLAMTRGLRVSASGAAATFKDERDARTVGRALGVDAIVEGTIQRSPEQVRIVARLIDVGTGYQRWSERFEGRLEDVFELQDRMAKRIAEALRVELTLLGHGAVASAEAVELYLRGRAVARESDTSGRSLEEAVEHFTKARTLAPAFALPLAAQADATVQRWFLSSDGDGTQWAEAAASAVESALEGAPDVAQTHLAAARWQVGRGQFTAAARHLTAALDIAPTFAAAHEYLGMLQCDAGRSREGVQHITLAHELDPSLNLGAFAALRHHALCSPTERYEAELARLRRTPKISRFGLDLFELRIATWYGDLARARAVQWPDVSIGGNSSADIFAVFTRSLEPETSNAQLERDLRAVADAAGSPRLRTVWRQMAVEVLARRGDDDAAMRVLVQTDGECVLLDADWLESCPLLQGLQADPRFAEIRSRVRGRADAIWRAGRSPAHD